MYIPRRQNEWLREPDVGQAFHFFLAIGKSNYIMDWLLTALAIFNLVSMIAVFRPRGIARRSAPWAQFGIALLATELAWIWLPLQVLITWLLCSGGALQSTLGEFALFILIVTWPGLAWSIWMSTKAGFASSWTCIAPALFQRGVVRCYYKFTAVPGWSETRAARPCP